jgi:hypothetical protein
MIKRLIFRLIKWRPTLIVDILKWIFYLNSLYFMMYIILLVLVLLFIILIAVGIRNWSYRSTWNKAYRTHCKATDTQRLNFKSFLLLSIYKGSFYYIMWYVSIEVDSKALFIFRFRYLGIMACLFLFWICRINRPYWIFI